MRKIYSICIYYLPVTLLMASSQTKGLVINYKGVAGRDKWQVVALE